jgi:uncharacterized protein YndB with AHSA1/START domain
MPDIFHELTVNAPPGRVFAEIATPQGLDRWWTKVASGEPRAGAEYSLYFGPEYDWRGRVTVYQRDAEFELEITQADADWLGTRVGFRIEPSGESATRVCFRHRGWPEANQHWRVSCYCWAMYLRLMRRSVEDGEIVEYSKRLDA